jgi:hypothetical protein
MAAAAAAAAWSPAENLLRLTERPPVTRLLTDGPRDLVVTRTDFPPAAANVKGVRTADTHFNLILLVALFLAVPGVPPRERLRNLGWALLAAVCFHLLSLVFIVKATYATQLGDWSAAHHGALARNFWGLGRHLLDLPFKFALPVLLWAGFYLRLLVDREPPGAAPGRRRK